MATYRVRDGERLAHAGQVHEGGAVVELPRAVAEDMAVRGALQEIDAQGQPIASPPADDLERFRAHERVSILRDRLVEAQARVAAIQQRLDAEEKALAAAVATAAKPAAKSSETKRPGSQPDAPAT